MAVEKQYQFNRAYLHALCGRCKKSDRVENMNDHPCWGHQSVCYCRSQKICGDCLKWQEEAIEDMKAYEGKGQRNPKYLLLRPKEKNGS